MKKFILSFLAILFLSTAVASAETVKFNWVYTNPPTDLKEFQIFQHNPAGAPDWILMTTVPAGERTVTLDGTLDPVSNTFGIWAVDNDDLHSNMKTATLSVNPKDIDSFIITIEYQVSSP